MQAFTDATLIKPWMNIGANSIKSAEPFQLPSYAVASLPSATPAGKLIYVPDEAGGATLAFSDGVNFLRVQDRAIVS